MDNETEKTKKFGLIKKLKLTKKTWIIIIIFLLAIAGGVIWFFINKASKENISKEQAQYQHVYKCKNKDDIQYKDDYTKEDKDDCELIYTYTCNASNCHLESYGDTYATLWDSYDKSPAGTNTYNLYLYNYISEEILTGPHKNINYAEQDGKLIGFFIQDFSEFSTTTGKEIYKYGFYSLEDKKITIPASYDLFSTSNFFIGYDDNEAYFGTSKIKNARLIVTSHPDTGGYTTGVFGTDGRVIIEPSQYNGITQLPSGNFLVYVLENHQFNIHLFDKDGNKLGIIEEAGLKSIELKNGVLINTSFDGSHHVFSVTDYSGKQLIDDIAFYSSSSKLILELKEKISEDVYRVLIGDANYIVNLKDKVFILEDTYHSTKVVTSSPYYIDLSDKKCDMVDNKCSVTVTDNQTYAIIKFEIEKVKDLSGGNVEYNYSLYFDDEKVDEALYGDFGEGSNLEFPAGIFLIGKYIGIYFDSYTSEYASRDMKFYEINTKKRLETVKMPYWDGESHSSQIYFDGEHITFWGETYNQKEGTKYIYEAAVDGIKKTIIEPSTSE